ncbi:MAG: ribosome small subunit-dependent GTPase A [Planctomycetaceae bacterium]|nr:ribosome small subunit-dependent GTPase A [Planctomycetaceae bacterium]
MGDPDKKKKFRTEFRKNRSPRTRQKDWAKQVGEEGAIDDLPRGERLSGKGELTKKRTVLGSDATSAGGMRIDVDADCRRGRVLSVHGLTCLVEADDGTTLQCAVRRILKTLATEDRHVVVAGDEVYFRLANDKEGMIERVEPRTGVISRTSRGRQHVIAANVEQMCIVSSAAEPYLKPHLIDRFIVGAERAQIKPIICITKIDLIAPHELQPLIGVYARCGYDVLPLSAISGFNVDALRKLLAGKRSVVVGQSGVGKSSLLNAVEPQLNLRVGVVSEETQKGKHTTTTAKLIKLQSGGYVVDTPGIRTMELWDVIPEEVCGAFRDLRPFIYHCRFPDCTHHHEAGCAVKDAVADGRLDVRRYESYLQLFAGD